MLADKGALAYFIQYMEARQRVGYIKLWLDAESFCAAAKCLQLTPSEVEPVSSVPWAVTRETLESVSANDTASIASTEDGSMSPSVEIAPRERTELHSVSEENEDVSSTIEEISVEESVLSRAESLARDALMDAVHIYRKYLSPHAVRKQAVQVPEEARISAVDHICREDGQVDPECFALAQQYVYNVMEKE